MTKKNSGKIHQKECACASCHGQTFLCVASGSAASTGDAKTVVSKANCSFVLIPLAVFMIASVNIWDMLNK